MVLVYSYVCALIDYFFIMLWCVYFMLFEIVLIHGNMLSVK